MAGSTLSIDATPIKTTVALLSGGLDSAVMVALLRRLQAKVWALSVDYGQVHHRELKFAEIQAERLGCEGFKRITVDVRSMLHGGVTGDIMPVRTLEEIRDAKGKSPAFLPGRNLIFLSLALAWAETLGAESVAIAATLDDQAGFPDCRRDFFDAVENMAERQVLAPLINMRKLDIVDMGAKWPELDYGQTWTCYTPVHGGAACGRCDACLVRLDAFAGAGLTDPIEYAVRL